MNTSELAKIVRDMDGLMPQPSRSLLARKILRGIILHLQENNATLYKEWVGKDGHTLFLQQCELKSPDPCVPADLNLQATDLANFCNRWMAVQQFREPGGDYKPFTPDMHHIRYTIIEELKGLHSGLVSDTQSE